MTSFIIIFRAYDIPYKTVELLKPRNTLETRIILRTSILMTVTVWLTVTGIQIFITSLGLFIKMNFTRR